MSLHIKITNRGAMEQLGSMFVSKRKKATKETKGQWKHNDKRHSGVHPDYTKKKKKYY